MNVQGDGSDERGGGGGSGGIPDDVVVSAPFADPDLPTMPKGTDLDLGEVYARRGLLVGKEAVALDIEQHDYVAAYLYYCSAVKILVASLKGVSPLFFSQYFFSPFCDVCHFHVVVCFCMNRDILEGQGWTCTGE